MTTFRMDLVLSEQLVPPSARDGEADDINDADDVSIILAHVCARADEDGCARFVVGGFGTTAWPVDVRTDLLTVLTQLPSIVAAVVEELAEFRLDFYEQGLERYLAFVLAEDEYRVHCTSGTQWRPEPEIVSVPVGEVVDMLLQLRDNFLALAAAICPRSSRHALFLEWKRTVALTAHARSTIL